MCITELCITEMCITEIRITEVIWRLNFTLQQVLTVTAEQGAKFTELEYMHLLHLLRRSHSNITDEDFNDKVQRLKRIITEKHIYHV